MEEGAAVQAAVLWRSARRGSFARGWGARCTMPASCIEAEGGVVQEALGGGVGDGGGGDVG
jgi:hypothetical protein